MNKLLPDLRFKGFEGEWKNIRLSNIVEKIKSYPISRKFESQVPTNLKYIHYGDIHTEIASRIRKDNSLPFLTDIKYDQTLEKGG